MKEIILTYTICQGLKDFGFPQDIWTGKYYDGHGELWYNTVHEKERKMWGFDHEPACLCPSLELACRWLQEVHGLDIETSRELSPWRNYCETGKYKYQIIDDKSKKQDIWASLVYGSRKEATTEAIKKALEILEWKKTM